MKLCNLNYLRTISPGNPKFIVEMIQLYLKNIPVSFQAMNNCLITADWKSMQNHAHKLISYFDCMGMPKEYRDTAKQIEDYASNLEHLGLIPNLLLKIENVFPQARKELEEELNKNFGIKN